MGHHQRHGRWNCQYNDRRRIHGLQHRHRHRLARRYRRTSGAGPYSRQPHFGKRCGEWLENHQPDRDLYQQRHGDHHHYRCHFRSRGGWDRRDSSRRARELGPIRWTAPPSPTWARSPARSALLLPEQCGAALHARRHGHRNGHDHLLRLGHDHRQQRQPMPTPRPTAAPRPSAPPPTPPRSPSPRPTMRRS